MGFAFPFAGVGFVEAALFAFAFGAGNGLMSITRGTLPLVLFDPRRYGAVTGHLLAPRFFLSAAAPVVLGTLIEMYGPRSAVLLCLLLAILCSGLAIALKHRASVSVHSD
jgi:MFS family permease